MGLMPKFETLSMSDTCMLLQKVSILKIHVRNLIEFVHFDNALCDCIWYLDEDMFVHDERVWSNIQYNAISQLFAASARRGH